MSTMVRVRAPHGFRPWWVVRSWLDVHQQQRASVNQFVRFFCWPGDLGDFFFNLLVFQKLLQCDVLFQVCKCLVSKNTKRRPNEGTLHWSPEADNSPGDISACQRGVGPDGLKAGNFRCMASWEWTCLDVLAKLVFLLLLLLLLVETKTGAPCNIQGFVLFCEACNLIWHPVPELVYFCFFSFFAFVVGTPPPLTTTTGPQSLFAGHGVQTKQQPSSTSTSIFFSSSGSSSNAAATGGVVVVVVK